MIGDFGELDLCVGATECFRPACQFPEMVADLVASDHPKPAAKRIARTISPKTCKASMHRPKNFLKHIAGLFIIVKLD